MANKPAAKPHHSPEVVKKAAVVLANPRASEISKTLAGSILGGVNAEEHGKGPAKK